MLHASGIPLVTSSASEDLTNETVLSQGDGAYGEPKVDHDGEEEGEGEEERTAEEPGACGDGHVAGDQMGDDSEGSGNAPSDPTSQEDGGGRPARKRKRGSLKRGESEALSHPSSGGERLGRGSKRRSRGRQRKGKEGEGEAVGIEKSSAPKERKGNGRTDEASAGMEKEQADVQKGSSHSSIMSGDWEGMAATRMGSGGSSSSGGASAREGIVYRDGGPLPWQMTGGLREPKGAQLYDHCRLAAGVFAETTHRVVQKGMLQIRKALAIV